MTASNFDKCLALTLVYEGGWTNNPKDPGGATMRGITQAVYEEDRDHRNLPRRSVRLITDAELQAIYRWRYWDLVKGDSLPDGVDYVMFDFAVNSGVSRAVKSLQRILGVTADGAMGSGTLTAALEYCTTYGGSALTDAVCVARSDFLKSLPTFATFGKGWMARVMGALEGSQAGDTGVIDRASAMASGGDARPPVSTSPTTKTYLAEVASA
jgi:lysozyme family protein